MSYRYNYNPFNVNIHKLRGDDLTVLRSVSEGWYVDYKSQGLIPRNIAKHLSSFANQYGGWLFFGIEENDDKCAGTFIGIDKSEVQDLLLKIREATSAHLQPSVFYEENIIDGPVDSIGLSDNKAIVVIYIPEGVNPPYVHSKGYIYRRISDQSDPEPETDRFILDQLWNKSKTSSANIKSFLSKRSDGKLITTPVAYIYLMTNTTFDHEFDKISYEEFYSITAKDREENQIIIPLTTVHSVSGGFIAKQTENNNPMGILTTLRWWHDGNARFTIPLSTFDWLHKGNYSDIKYEYKAEFIEQLINQDFRTCLITDVNYLFFVLLGLYRQFSKIKERTNNKQSVRGYCVIENTRQMIPFVDDIEYIKHVTQYGIPVIEDEKIVVPYWHSEEDSAMLVIDSNNNKKEIEKIPFANHISEIAVLFTEMLLAVGILNVKNDVINFRGLFDLRKIKGLFDNR